MSEQQVEEKHRWVEFRRRVVEPVGPMEDGTPAVVSMDAEEVAVFCDVCGLGLTEHARSAPCAGEWPEEDG